VKEYRVQFKDGSVLIVKGYYIQETPYGMIVTGLNHVVRHQFPWGSLKGITTTVHEG